MRPYIVVSLVVLALVILPAVALAQGPGTTPPANAPVGWYITKFVPTEFYDRARYDSLGWSVQSSGWGWYMGKTVQGYWLIKWQAAPTNGFVVAPAYSLYESQCQSMGPNWHYNWQTRRCYITF